MVKSMGETVNYLRLVTYMATNKYWISLFFPQKLHTLKKTKTACFSSYVDDRYSKNISNIMKNKLHEGRSWMWEGE
jgi:hypothetical protein